MPQKQRQFGGKKKIPTVHVPSAGRVTRHIDSDSSGASKVVPTIYYRSRVIRRKHGPRVEDLRVLTRVFNPNETRFRVSPQHTPKKFRKYLRKMERRINTRETPALALFPTIEIPPAPPGNPFLTDFCPFCDSIKMEWALDSSCPNHMTPKETCFVSLDRNFNQIVSFGRGSTVKSKGKGSVRLGPLIIPNVLLMPGIIGSFVSVSQLMEQNFAFVFKGGWCTVFDQFGKPFLSVPKIGRCFPLNMAHVTQTGVAIRGKQDQTGTVKVCCVKKRVKEGLKEAANQIMEAEKGKKRERPIKLVDLSENPKNTA